MLKETWEIIATIEKFHAHHTIAIDGVYIEKQSHAN
jgi:hypothetical protein